MSLDIRQNTTVINRVLQEIWHKMNPVAQGSRPQGRQRRNGPHGSSTNSTSRWASCRNFFGVSEETRELLDLLYLIRETLDGPDPQAIGTFILSMTQHCRRCAGALSAGQILRPVPR